MSCELKKIKIIKILLIFCSLIRFERLVSAMESDFATKIQIKAIRHSILSYELHSVSELCIQFQWEILLFISFIFIDRTLLSANI